MNTKVKTDLDNLVIGNKQISFTLGRSTYKEVLGADSHLITQLKARAEYYSLARNSENAVIKADPMLAANMEVDGEANNTWYYHILVEPSKGIIATTQLIDPKWKKNSENRSTIFPINNKSITWYAYGFNGYAYADIESRLLTYIQYGSEPCSIELPARLDHTTLLNNIYDIFLSGDGSYVAVSNKQGVNREIEIYKGCKKITNQIVSIDYRFRGFCVTSDNYWYVFENEKKRDLIANKNGSNINALLPEGVRYKNMNEIQDQTPVFDCEKQIFFWTTTSSKQTKEHTTIVLHQYDTAVNKESTTNLILGKPL